MSRLGLFKRDHPDHAAQFFWPRSRRIFLNFREFNTAAGRYISLNVNQVFSQVLYVIQ